MIFLKRDEGFTLVEVLVAAALLLLVVLVVSAFLLQGYRFTSSAGKRSETAHLAQEDMEKSIENAITGGDLEFAGEDLEIDSEVQTIIVFGEPVHGKLITVTRSCAGDMGGEVVYQYFVVDGVGN